MNKIKKYCPNVWVAECEQEYEKGEVIQLENQHGKEVDCEVYNLVSARNEKFYYSVVTVEEKSYAERKAERYSNEALAEPVKVGHHSEKRHRALIERNNNRWIRQWNTTTKQKNKGKKQNTGKRKRKI